jgi:hypothetical protein
MAVYDFCGEHTAFFPVAKKNNDQVVGSGIQLLGKMLKPLSEFDVAKIQDHEHIVK